MFCEFNRKVVPALDTTFSSIITLPKSFAPYFSAIWPMLGPLRDPGALHVLECYRGRCGDSACMRRYSLLPTVFGLQAGVLRLERPADERGEAAGFVLLYRAGAADVRSDRRSSRRGRTSSSRWNSGRARARFASLRATASLLHFSGAMRSRTRSTRISPPPPGMRAQPGLLEFRNHFAQRHSEDLREMVELRRAEAVDVDVRILRADVRRAARDTSRCRASDDARLA